MPPILLLPLLLLLFLLPSAIASPTSSVAHCECRCCTHSSLIRRNCSSLFETIPLPPSQTCDHLHTFPSNNENFCSTAMCTANFPSLCPLPLFVAHTCIPADRGFLFNWAPLLFSCVMLIALTILFYARATKGPDMDEYSLRQVIEDREMASVPGGLATQPLLTASPLLYDGSRGPPAIEIVDVGPRSPSVAGRKPITSSPLHYLPSPNRSFGPLSSPVGRGSVIGGMGT